MKKLPLVNLTAVDNILSPNYNENINLSSSAMSVFTDFKYQKAQVIEADTTATQALQLMQKSHVRMKVAISNEEDFLGIISTNEISEQNIIARLSKGIHRDDILVKDLMIPKFQLHAFELNDLVNATVGDIVTTLGNYKLRHCVVLDKYNHHIRGVISSSDIARKLQMNAGNDNEFSFNTIYEEAYIQ
ncbi:MULTISPECIES: CBS domain-containing protein [Thalassotalea]|uniref:CBS domain-containing protein n=1 Tax=Thalassotalea castellviae TaxID=3075612 RepID=A0ABU2ZZH8_9GAMM|nr:CBS domain-containing protein [Thalassotalea sp. W431]MDT0603018.1 CBS domain-containing protein [Thalassotalea sp. W431]